MVCVETYHHCYDVGMEYDLSQTDKGVTVLHFDNNPANVPLKGLHGVFELVDTQRKPKGFGAWVKHMEK